MGATNFYTVPGIVYVQGNKRIITRKLQEKVSVLLKKGERGVALQRIERAMKGER
jgi:hypothetical protein